jgi:hypothetical protein
MANTKTRTGPYYAVIYTRCGSIRGAGGMYSTVALRRGRPAPNGEGTVYPSYAAAIAAAKKYAEKHGGEADAQSAK